MFRKNCLFLTIPMLDYSLQVRGHHITPICDYEKTSMRMGAIYISVPKFHSQFPFLTFYLSG